MNDHRVIQFPTEAVHKGNAPRTYGKQTDSAHLENSTSDGADMSKGAFDMSKKRIRQRAKIGDQCVWVSGETQQELFDDYLCQAIAAGLVVPADAVGEARAHKTPTVRQFVEETYAPTFSARLAPRTVVNYRLYLDLNILPFLGDMPMDQVTVATIQQFYDWMATAGEHGRKKNLNACTIRRVSGLASRIFKVAMEMKIIPETPFKHSLLNIRAEEAGHHKAMTDEEIQRVRQAIPHLQDWNERLYMGLLAYTGMRPEEALGMCWENVALEQQYAKVVQAATYPGNSRAYIGKPKTAHAAQTVLLPKALVEILRPEQQPRGYLLGGDKPWCYSHKTQVSKRALAHLHLEGYSDADFRTTFGTQMKEYGKTSAEVADLMGHADTRMVERVYARTRHEGVMKHLYAVEKSPKKGPPCDTLCDKAQVRKRPKYLGLRALKRASM